MIFIFHCIITVQLAKLGLCDLYIVLQCFFFCKLWSLCPYLIIFIVFAFFFYLSRKKRTYRHWSRCCWTRSLLHTSFENGRRPMRPWCRRSVSERTSRWQQRPQKLQHQSVLLQWWRLVYKDSEDNTLTLTLNTHIHWCFHLRLLFHSGGLCAVQQVTWSVKNVFLVAKCTWCRHYK